VGLWHPTITLNFVSRRSARAVEQRNLERCRTFGFGIRSSPPRGFTLHEAQLSTLFWKLDERDEVTPDERAAIADCVGREMAMRAGGDLVREGDRPAQSTLLVQGFAVRYRVLRHGQRQITAVHIPGDFVDLHSLLLKQMDHAVGALTDCEVLLFPHDRLTTLTQIHPHLTRLLWLSTLIDAAAHREWLVAIGRRTAAQHIAHLICELYVRLKVIRSVEDQTFSLPITQIELGDILGLSAVHVNRTLQALREEKLFTWHKQTVRILDWQRLQEWAEFDPLYLHLSREPR
jgi:CRP-like cAMP-binding protein